MESGDWTPVSTESADVTLEMAARGDLDVQWDVERTATHMEEDGDSGSSSSSSSRSRSRSSNSSSNRPFVPSSRLFVTIPWNFRAEQGKGKLADRNNQGGSSQKALTNHALWKSAFVFFHHHAQARMPGLS